MASQENLQIQCRKLTDKHTTDSLHVLSVLVATTMGPYGGIKMLGNDCGGHLFLTTLSSRLLNALTPASPLVKLILTAADQQVQSFGDAGLFTAGLTLNLVFNGIQTGISQKLLIESNTALLDLLLGILDSSDFPCKMLVKTSDIETWTCVASTMLLAKPLCGLDQEEAHLIAQLLFEAFVIKLPATDSGLRQTNLGDVHIVGMPGQSSDQSFCCEGLLLELNNLSETKDWLHKENLSLKSTTTFRCLVVNVSMSGDSDEFLDVIFEGSSLESLEEGFLGYIEDFCHQLTTLDIKIVFCQKVIHPRIKELLRTKGILVIDRLGSDHCPQVLSLTGANPTSSFSTPVTADQVGNVYHLSIMDIGKRSFLHMKQNSSSMATLVLLAYMEEQLEELKKISKNILVVLDHLIKKPFVLFGGGCWQFCLTNLIRKKVKMNQGHLSKELQCSSYQLLEVCEYFCRCLEQSSRPHSSSGSKCYTHPSIGHLWSVDRHLAGMGSNLTSCMCGVKKYELVDLNPLPEEYFSLGYLKQDLSDSSNATNSSLANDGPLEIPSLMDSFVSWRNSMETSVKMANMALGTKQFIFESVH